MAQYQAYAGLCHAYASNALLPERTLIVEALNEYFKGDKLAAAMNMTIKEVAPGHAVVAMPITDMHKNGLDAAHGGAIFSLADFCFAVASNSHGRVAVAVNASISFFRAAFSGVLTATARETHLGERIAGYVIDVTDESGALVAAMQGVVYRKADTIAAVLKKRSEKESS
ncbi:MAG TPA: PaaI family thioesterase [Candidatus Hydrogenedentes bacterium]|nr:PaaI family thioesterase [Candidatus Hydrogenedentota bacterium]